MTDEQHDTAAPSPTSSALGDSLRGILGESEDPEIVAAAMRAVMAGDAEVRAKLGPEMVRHLFDLKVELVVAETGADAEVARRGLKFLAEEHGGTAADLDSFEVVAVGHLLDRADGKESYRSLGANYGSVPAVRAVGGPAKQGLGEAGGSQPATPQSGAATVLRWLAMLPAAVVAGLAATAIAGLVLTEGVLRFTPGLELFISRAMLVAWAESVLGAAAFVYVGSGVAPSHRASAAVALTVLQASIFDWGGGTLSPTRDVPSPSPLIINLALGLVGSLLVIAVRRTEVQEATTR